MKKTCSAITICFFSLSLAGQNTITTERPCTDAMTQNATGRWIKATGLGSPNSKENILLDQIHGWILKLYPQPTGVDAVWSRSTAGVSYFSVKRKFDNPNDKKLTFDKSSFPHFNQSSYAVRFFRYRCEYSKTHTLQMGYPGVTNTSIFITSNVKLGDMVTDDTWTINGLPVIMLKPVMKKMDGLEFLHRGGTFDVIVHRKGDLLYKPVSRKDYLTYCLTYWTKLWDETIKGTEQMPAQTADEQRIRDDRLNKDKKLKAACLKKFTDELEKTSKEGLLDSTAMVRVMYHPDLIFETKPDQGWILVTENPDYIRKDLPKHVPQFFIVSWRCEEWAPTTKICELFKKDFPFDKLQAMIDK